MQQTFCEYGHFYVIGRGETLSEIAEKFEISLKELLELNPYLNPSYYLPGQIILVPKEIPGDYVLYTVKRGEYLRDLLRRFEMNIADLRVMNPELDIFNIRHGEKIWVKKCRGDYEIGENETLYTVAKKMNLEPLMLLRMNPHLRPNEFSAGQLIRTKQNTKQN